jgi:hypothetical protein
MYAAVLDACVLVPTALCDTLLRLAEAGFCRPVLSARILEEVHDAVLRVHSASWHGRTPFTGQFR